MSTMQRLMAVAIAGLFLGACQDPTKPITDNASSLPQFARIANVTNTTDLGTLGGSFSRAFGINERGQVVGWNGLDNGEEPPFLWKAGTMIDLGPGTGYEINNRGQVAGSGPSANGGEVHATLWTVTPRNAQ